MTAHSVLNVRAAPEWGNSDLYKYYERNGLGYGTIHRGRGIRGRSASHPGWGRGMTTNAPSTTTQGNAQSQPGHRSRPGCPGPAEMAAKYRSMCSRSTTDTQYRPPSGRLSGLERENVSSTTSPQGRLRRLLLRKRLL